MKPMRELTTTTARMTAKSIQCPRAAVTRADVSRT
jgi:hypothetical protein